MCPEVLEGIVDDIMAILIFRQVTLGEDEKLFVVFPVYVVEVFSFDHFLLVFLGGIHVFFFEVQRYKKYLFFAVFMQNKEEFVTKMSFFLTKA